MARTAGKLLGGGLGVKLSGVDFPAARYLPPALLPHAGVAIALSMSVERLHPEFSALVSVVVLSAVLVFEVVGPFFTRLSLYLAKEDRAPVATYDLDVLERGPEIVQEEE